jgi:hypothetical protein
MQVKFCGQPRCSGGKGFGVTPDGRYYVGASSAQANQRGQLSVTEQEIISKAAVAAASQTFSASARCVATDPSPGSLGSGVDLGVKIWPVGAQAATAIYETTLGGRRTCVRGDAALAGTLRDALYSVVAKYDPVVVPQPSPTPTPTSQPSPQPSPRP